MEHRDKSDDAFHEHPTLPDGRYGFVSDDVPAEPHDLADRISGVEPSERDTLPSPKGVHIEAAMGISDPSPDSGFASAALESQRRLSEGLKEIVRLGRKAIDDRSRVDFFIGFRRVHESFDPPLKRHFFVVFARWLENKEFTMPRTDGKNSEIWVVDKVSSSDLGQSISPLVTAHKLPFNKTETVKLVDVLRGLKS